MKDDSFILSDCSMLMWSIYIWVIFLSAVHVHLITEKLQCFLLLQGCLKLIVISSRIYVTRFACFLLFNKKNVYRRSKVEILSPYQSHAVKPSNITEYFPNKNHTHATWKPVTHACSMHVFSTHKPDLVQWGMHKVGEHYYLNIRSFAQMSFLK